MHRIRTRFNYCIIFQEHAVKDCQSQNSNMLSENKKIMNHNIKLTQDLYDMRQTVNDTRDERCMDKELLRNISQLQADNVGFSARVDILYFEKEAVKIELDLCQNVTQDLSLREKSLIAKNGKLIVDKNRLEAERGENSFPKNTFWGDLSFIAFIK